jgi:type IV pilus assembly protein PilV
MTQPTYENQSGFTLLEVLCALAIFSIGLLAVNAMTTMVIKSNYKSRHLTTAVHLAQNKLEELKAGAYASVADSTETSLDSQETAGTGMFDRRVSVTTRSEPDYKTVEVIISWSDPEPRDAVFQTIIAR